MKSKIEELYKNKRDEFVRYAMRRVGSREDAEEIVNDCFLSALSTTFKRPSNIENWFRRSLVNKITDLYRSRYNKRGVELDGLDTERFGEGCVENHSSAREQLSAVINLINNTPDERRKFILMRVLVEGYTYKEVSDMIGGSRNSIRCVVKKFRRRLRSE